MGGDRAFVRAGWLLTLGLGACQTGAVPTTPWLGPQPASIVVAPPRLVDAPAQDALLAGADTAFGSRGYRVLPLGVGLDLIAKERLLPGIHLENDDLRRVRSAMDVESVLLLDVRLFEVEASPFDAARWDLEWRLLSTTTGQLLWRHAERGSWQRSRGEPVDPTRAPGEERNVQPFGHRGPQDFRSPGELMRALHRTAASRLPRRES